MTGRPVTGILAAVGDTPLVRLDRLLPGVDAAVYAKMERFNPGGSIKDRSATSMLEQRIRDGRLVPGRSVVVESSSGNLAVGLAMICRYHGLRFICVVDAKTTTHNLRILEALRAEVEVVTERDAATGEYLPTRLRRVRELLAAVPDAYWPNQYDNPLNPMAHHTTMREIARALDGRVDYVFCPTSTGGTMVGCSQYVRANGLSTKVIAVDAYGSVLFGLPKGRRLIPGHGASVRPPVLDADAADEVVHVSDLECVVACRSLVDREAVLAGGSSGAVVAALGKCADRLPAGAVCALVFPDGGDRYLDTIYSDDWVHANFGEVSHLWKEAEVPC